MAEFRQQCEQIGKKGSSGMAEKTVKRRKQKKAKGEFNLPSHRDRVETAMQCLKVWFGFVFHLKSGQLQLQPIAKLTNLVKNQTKTDKN